MTLYLPIKYLHVLGAIVILGTGSGIAFFMLMAHRSGHAEFIARIASIVVLAERWLVASLVKTGPAIMLMPVALLVLDNR